MANCRTAGHRRPALRGDQDLVYSAGNYRFTDFARLGVPMNLIVWATSSLLIPLFWPLTPV